MARAIVAPEGWTTSLLDKVTDRGSGHTPDKEFPEYWNGGIKWVSLADSCRLDVGYIDATDKEISAQGVSKSSAVVHPMNTVIMSRDAGVGKSAVLKFDMAVSQHFIAWRCERKEYLDPWFLYNWLQFHKLEFERQAVGSTIKTIGLPYFKRLSICHPPLPEQRRIAEILSTWDGAIETTQKLIANARAQKKALMQSLLTGKHRLPGFDGEWKRAPLRELGDISSAGVDKKLVEGETTIRLLNFLDVYKREFIFDSDLNQVVTAPAAKVGQCDVRRGDVFFTPSSETRDDIALSAVAAEDMPGVAYSYHVVRFRPAKMLDLAFSAYLFQTDAFRIQAARLGDGSGQRYVISQPNFRKMEITVPPMAEQAAIGAILKNQSDSIGQLQSQLMALRQEKSALIQQLLTGKRRVKLDLEEEPC